MFKIKYLNKSQSQSSFFSKTLHLFSVGGRSFISSSCSCLSPPLLRLSLNVMSGMSEFGLVFGVSLSFSLSLSVTKVICGVCSLARRDMKSASRVCLFLFLLQDSSLSIILPPPPSSPYITLTLCLRRESGPSNSPNNRYESISQWVIILTLRIKLDGTWVVAAVEHTRLRLFVNASSSPPLFFFFNAEGRPRENYTRAPSNFNRTPSRALSVAGGGGGGEGEEMIDSATSRPRESLIKHIYIILQYRFFSFNLIKFWPLSGVA